jgi:hypothetical protein
MEFQGFQECHGSVESRERNVNTCLAGSLVQVGVKATRPLAMWLFANPPRGWCFRLDLV